jgi:hypothetical protein
MFRFSCKDMQFGAIPKHWQESLLPRVKSQQQKLNQPGAPDRKYSGNMSGVL